MAKPTSRPRLLTVAQVAVELSCSRTHVYDLIASKRLPVVDISATGTRAKSRITTAALDAYIAKHTRVA
jgi:excisionase family DNA binding protein